ncbi:MAG TPA: GxxExxY protein [Vicinamibacterales bacterium]|nr:GxxExxY protein [Vicinamibacterales bacterium]
MIRISSSLDERTEACLAEVVDSGIAVHREVGPGFTEPTYRNAMRVELIARGIPFSCETTFTVPYRGQTVGVYRLDFVVRDCVVVELKAVKNLEPVHLAQVMAYLKASKLRAGLLMNFSGATLKEGLKRIVL